MSAGPAWSSSARRACRVLCRTSSLQTRPAPGNVRVLLAAAAARALCGLYECTMDFEKWSTLGKGFRFPRFVP